MPLQNDPANRQTQARTPARIALQSHEWPKDLFQVGRRDSRSVVANGEEPLLGPPFNGDSDLRSRRSPMLQRIAEQVFEDFHQPVRVSRHRRQLFVERSGAGKHFYTRGFF